MADTGLLLNSTRKIQFYDATQFIHGSSATVLSLGATDEIDLTATAIDINGTGNVSGTLTCSASSGTGLAVTTDATVGGTLGVTGIGTFTAQSVHTGGIKTGAAIISDTTNTDALGSAAITFSDIYLGDGAVINLGEDQDVTLTHIPDKGITLKHNAAGDNKPIILTLATGETEIVADEVIGAINFQAPDEGSGTDAILVCAGIEAVSEGVFSGTNNATKLSFKTAASAEAAETMSLSSAGNLTVSGDLTITGGNITNAITFDAGITNAGTIAAGAWGGTTIPVNKGGTGETTAGDARTSLGLGTIATQASDSVNILSIISFILLFVNCS